MSSHLSLQFYNILILVTQGNKRSGSGPYRISALIIIIYKFEVKKKMHDFPSN